jgi:hypothetical protein
MVVPSRWRFSLRFLTIVGTALVLFARSNSGSAEPGPNLEPWPAGQPIAIQVESGHASFDLPTPRPGWRSLVVVSALASPRGPYPIRLDVKPSDQTKPIPRASQRPFRRPDPQTLAPLPIPPIVTGLPPERRTFHLIAHGGDVANASSYFTTAARLTRRRFAT